MPFTPPAAPGDGIQFKDHLGALLLIEVLGFEEKIKTSFGDNDAVRANVHVIEGPGAGDSYEDTLIFPRLLVSQTKKAIGQKVLGRLGQGNAKPGQSAPWILEEATEEDTAKAEAWVSNHAPAVTAPAPPF